jgi:hypothetical protein
MSVFKYLQLFDLAQNKQCQQITATISLHRPQGLVGTYMIICKASPVAFTVGLNQQIDSLV